MKLLFVFGTRPEAIKMSPVIRAAEATPEFSVCVCVTGQHRDMLDQVLNFFGICPDYDLSAMQPDQDLCGLTARVLDALRTVIEAEGPDIVVVQGDTTSAFAAAVAAFFNHIPVAHIEAGLRTYNRESPFPEEGIRQMISRVASIHFAATPGNVQTLLDEQVPAHSIFLTGNPVIDAAVWTRDQVRQSGADPLRSVIGDAAMESINQAEHILLATMHRRENVGGGVREICAAISDLAAQRPQLAIVCPVHPNPNVREQVYVALKAVPNVHLTQPLDYPTFIHLMDRCSLILSDSGGVQEEAPALGKRVLVARSTTERQEAVECGSVRIVGTDRANIVTAVNAMLYVPAAVLPIVNPFGDGHAAEKIVAVLLRHDLATARASASLLSLSAALGYTANAGPNVVSLSDAKVKTGG